MKKILLPFLLLLTITACSGPGFTLTDTSPSIKGNQSGFLLTPSLQPDLETSAFLSLWNPTERQHELHLVNTLTGEDVAGYPPIILGTSTQYSPTFIRSPDGNILATVTGIGGSCEPFAGGSACRASADTLHLIYAQSWEVFQAPIPEKGWVWPRAFSPDASRLALAINERETSTLLVFDVGARQVIGRRSLNFRPSLITFVGNGETLAVYGSQLGKDPGITPPGPPQILLLHTADLAIRWAETLAEVLSGGWCLENCAEPYENRTFANWSPALVPDHDRSRLYIVHADEDRLTTVDFEAQTVQNHPIGAPQTWLENLLALSATPAQAKGATNGAFKSAVLSPDGSQLYVVGQATRTHPDGDVGLQVEETSFGLQVIEVATGKVLSTRKTNALYLQFTGDGKHLLLENNLTRETEIIDAESLQRVASLPRWHLEVIHSMGGNPLLLASQSGAQGTNLALLDPVTFEVAHSWEAKSQATWSVSP